MNFAEWCPWLDMAETERSHIKNLRSALFSQLQIIDGNEYCWLTGKHRTNPSQSHVKVAHIIPDSTKNSIFEKLRLPPSFKNEIKSTSANFLLLDESIEYAFDHLAISFVPVNILNPHTLTLKIWDSSYETNPVCVGNSAEQAEDMNKFTKIRAVIKDYEGAELKFPTGYLPSLRALSYQALCAYIYNKTKKTLRLEANEPADFSTEFEGKDETRKELARILNRQTIEEIEEEEYRLAREGGLDIEEFDLLDLNTLTADEIVGEVAGVAATPG